MDDVFEVFLCIVVLIVVLVLLVKVFKFISRLLVNLFGPIIRYIFRGTAIIGVGFVIFSIIKGIGITAIIVGIIAILISFFLGGGGGDPGDDSGWSDY